MAKKQKYEQLANQIIDLIGGKENVTFLLIVLPVYDLT